VIISLPAWQLAGYHFCEGGGGVVDIATTTKSDRQASEPIIRRKPLYKSEPLV